MEEQQRLESNTKFPVPAQAPAPPSAARNEPRVSPPSNSEPFVDDESDEEIDIGSSRCMKKARRETQPNWEPMPPTETDQTQELGSAALVEDPVAGHDSDEDSCMQDAECEDDDDGAHPLLERVVSDEQAAADLEEIRGMWELAAVYEFMVQFKYWLNFSQLYPVQDLEEALVRSPGPGLLAQLHVDLLQGIATRSQVGQENWASTLAARLISEANAMQQPLTSLPFKPVRGKEALGYAVLTARQRVLTLKALADMRADREDMRMLVDDIMRAQPGSSEPGGRRGASGSNTPPRRSARASSAPPPPPALSAEDMRGRGPLGCDAAGCKYYWFDMPYDHDAPVGLMGSRLYVEGPSCMPSSAQLLQQNQQPTQPGLQNQSAEKQPRKHAEGEDTAAPEAVTTVQSPLPPRPLADSDDALTMAGTHDTSAGSNYGLDAEGSKQQQETKHEPYAQQHHTEQSLLNTEQDKQTDVKPQAAEQQQQQQKTAAGVQDVPGEQAAAAVKQETGAAKASTTDDDSMLADSKPQQCAAGAAGAADVQSDRSACSNKSAEQGKKRSADEAADGEDKFEANREASDAAAVETLSRKKKCRTSSDRIEAATTAAAASLLLARPGRKAGAEAAVKVAQQLGKRSADTGQVTAQVATSASTAAAKKPPRGNKVRGSSKGNSTAASEDTGSPNAAQQCKAVQHPNTDAADAALAASLDRRRPTRRAAADASAKIAAQAQNPPIYKLAEDAAVAAAAASKASAGSGKIGKARKGGSEAGSEKAIKRVGEDYVLPADELAGIWRLAADSVEGLEAMAHQLSEHDDEADVALARLLLEQVVATLLERKDREEKYARARSRVAKSLGLDVPAAESGRPQRQRRKPATYNFEDYDRSMRRAILAAERGEFEELPAPGREPYKAPPYDIEVRRGRSGGAAEPVPTLEEIEAMRKRRIELAKLGLLDTDNTTSLQEGQEEQGQAKAADSQAADNAQHEQQPPLQAGCQQAAGGDPTAGNAVAVCSSGQLQEQPAADTAAPAAAAPTAKELLASAGGVAQARPHKLAPASRRSFPGVGGAARPRKPAAPKARPAQPATPPSAWQITATAAASGGAEGGSMSGGRPRRRAAAGVAAAVAAAAAAAGGREEDFLGMASHMQSEWEAHHGADHTGQAGLLQGVDVTALNEGVELLQRGHFHSSSAQSINRMAEPHDTQLQQQAVLQLPQQGQGAPTEPVSWDSHAQQHTKQQIAPGLAACQPATADKPVGAAVAAAVAAAAADMPQQATAEQGILSSGALPTPAAAEASFKAALTRSQAVTAGGTMATTEAPVPPPLVSTWADGIFVYAPAAAQVECNMHPQVHTQPQEQQLPNEAQHHQQQRQMAGAFLPCFPSLGKNSTQQQQQDQQHFAQQAVPVDFAAALPGCPTAGGMQQQPVLPGIPVAAAAAQYDQQHT